MFGEESLSAETTKARSVRAAKASAFSGRNVVLRLCLLLSGLGGFAPDAAIASSSVEESLLGLRALDKRVATVSYRLSRSTLDICENRRFLTGFVAHSLSQYSGPFREAAARLFRLDEGTAVLTVAKGSAADRAGILPNDILLFIDGTPVPQGEPQGANASFAATARINQLLESSFGDGKVVLQLKRGEDIVTTSLQPEQGCASHFQVVPSKSFGASADGAYVQITSALVMFAREDEDLAAVLAHELSHNILQHRRRLDDAGIKRGLLKYFGRNARLIRATEVEADRLSVYLLEMAGYPPEAAARLWERLGPRKPWGMFGSTTHPDWKHRVAMLLKEAEALRALKSEGIAPSCHLARVQSDFGGTLSLRNGPTCPAPG